MTTVPMKSGRAPHNIAGPLMTCSSARRPSQGRRLLWNASLSRNTLRPAFSMSRRCNRTPRCHNLCPHRYSSQHLLSTPIPCHHRPTSKVHGTRPPHLRHQCRGSSRPTRIPLLGRRCRCHCCLRAGHCKLLALPMAFPPARTISTPSSILVMVRLQHKVLSISQCRGCSRAPQCSTRLSSLPSRDGRPARHSPRPPSRVLPSSTARLLPDYHWVTITTIIPDALKALCHHHTIIPVALVTFALLQRRQQCPRSHART